MRSPIAVALLGVLGVCLSITSLPAQTTEKEKQTTEQAKKKPASSRFPAWDTVLKGAEKVTAPDGERALVNLYFNKKQNQLFMELGSGQLNKDFLLPIAIARGPGMTYLGGGMLNFGDQWVIRFERSGNYVHVIRPNIYFQAKKGSPTAEAVKTSYTDSVISALRIRSEKGGSVLVDLADLLMTDLANVGIRPDRTRSKWVKVKAFPKNVEIELSAVFSGYSSFRGAVPDPRGTQVVMHYGLAAMPSGGGFRPRQADDRIGHFLSVIKDFSSDADKTPFRRYVTRWKLVKSDTSAEKSPPVEPIIFWIEKTVPRKYRRHVKEGILEWNKAFEKIGFLDAIEVRDQRDSDVFDPEDMRFNTFRWIATSRGFAMGPSRTNPKTGQILDADIVFDESMVRYSHESYRRTVGLEDGLKLLRSGERQAWLKLYAADVPLMLLDRLELNRLLKQPPPKALPDQVLSQTERLPIGNEPSTLLKHQCHLGQGMQRQLGLAAVLLYADGKTDPDGKVPEKLIAQMIKHIVMHEVGHTLGLRHNFKASTMLSLEDVNNPEITAKRGMVGSVMDYSPVNIAPKGQEQGDYYSPTLGPYDYWAIEYAYKPLSGNEATELAKIASRVAEPDLAFGTDPDLFYNPDPRINLWDLGDPLEYSKQQLTMAEQRLSDLAQRVVSKGEGWQRSRHAFNLLLGEIANAAYQSAQYIGAEYTYRDHRDDPNARTPLEPVPSAKQREAIALIKEHILSADTFRFSSELLKRMPPEYWSHWGFFNAWKFQYPIHEQVLAIQRIVLSRFLDPEVLLSLQNIELHAEPDEEVLKMPEVFDALTDAIWSELPTEAPANEIAISTIRRNLQREHFRRLADLVLGKQRGMSLFDLLFGSGSDAPADARSLARHHLRMIGARINLALDAETVKVDAYTQAHLEELQDRITKVLDASLEVNEL